MFIHNVKSTQFSGITVLSLDYGHKATGVAKYSFGRDPFVLGAGRLLEPHQADFASRLGKVIQEEDAEAILVGLPLEADGAIGDMAKKVVAWSVELQQQFKDLRFYCQDETLTTQAAKERMESSPLYDFKYNPKKIDEVSAIIILEDYLQHESLSPLEEIALKAKGQL